jgi:outer membrane protein assembly factor BamB
MTTRPAIRARSLGSLWHTMCAGVFLLAAIGVSAPAAAPAPAPAGGDVLTFHGDFARTGWVANEPTLTPDTVRAGRFGKLWTAPVEGEIYAEPLVVSGVAAGGATPRTMIYTVTERDLVYALDAATGRVVWGPVSVGSPVPRASLPCGNIDPVGITSTPVIDRASSTLYLVGLTTPDGGRTKVYKAAALDLASGRMRPGWPVTIAPPASDGRQFAPAAQQQRAALGLAHGVLYVPFGGYFGDCGQYHGWVIGVPVGDPGHQQSFAVPTQRMGAIWAAGGVSIDAAGNLYVSTGNSESGGAVDFGNAVLRLQTEPTLRFSRATRDYFVPSNFVALNAGDVDLGSAAPLLLPPQPGPAPHLIFIAGKQGVGYLINADDMGGLSKGDGVTGEGVYSRCVFGSCRGGRPEVFSAAAYWDGGSAGRFVVVPGRGPQPAPCRGTGGVAALKLGAAGGAGFDVAWCSGSMSNAGAPAVSSAGASGGLVWVVDSAEGVLHALNAVTGAEVYASSGPDLLGSAHQFITPAIAAGHVYVGAGHTVAAYGLR